MKRVLFGTDGIRGKANIYPMTGEVAFSLGRAVTNYFQQKNKKSNGRKPLIIVGKDTRLSCYMLEQAFSAGVCAQGGEVILTGPLPTPGVAFVTKSMRADAGVMISASHNSYQDNGIKIFDSEGYKLPDEVELKLESMVLKPETMKVQTGQLLGNAKRLKEVFGRYIVHCKASLNEQYDMTGMRVVLDCANGAGYRVAPMMLSELGAEVFSLGVEPNGTNINSDCGSLYPSKASTEVLKYRADYGICLDGDADRIIVIDEKGHVVDGDILIGIFAQYMLEQGLLKKGDIVVGTVMTNMGLENYLKKIGLNLHRTKVGDRYILEYMREKDCILGGEPSGHIIFKKHSTTGDGSLAAIKVAEVIKSSGKPLSKLAASVKLYPQLLTNIKVTEKKPLEENSNIASVLESVSEKLGDKGRYLVRYSGTESILRVMVECEKMDLAQEVNEQIVRVVEQELGQ